MCHAERKPIGSRNGKITPPSTYFHPRHQPQAIGNIPTQTILGQA